MRVVFKLHYTANNQKIADIKKVDDQAVLTVQHEAVTAT